MAIHFAQDGVSAVFQTSDYKIDTLKHYFFFGHLEKLAAAPRYANLVIEDVILWSGSDGAAGVFRR